MAKSQTSDQQSLAAQQAMNQVLQAEHEAEQAIVECGEYAMQLLEEAQKRSQLISKRADNRITSIHLRCKQDTAKRLNQLAREHAHKQKQHAEYHLDEKTIADIVDEVAGFLTGPQDFSTALSDSD
jgi:vacuolar-type H+-ATPase subunit H